MPDSDASASEEYEGVQRLGHLERLDLARRPIERAFLDEQAAIEQHPHRLDRVQWHALSAREDLLAHMLGQTGHESLEQVAHGPLRKRIEIEGREVALTAAPSRPALVELRSRERDHVQREVARPLEQVFDEVEQARVRPLHVFEREHRRARIGEALEEQPPRREQILPVARGRLLQREQVREPRLHERALLRIEHVPLHHRAEFRARRARILGLADPGTHPHHVRQRPVGDTLAVGEAAAAVPVHLLDDPVEVLVELPDQPRLAVAGDPDHRHEVCTPIVRAAVEEVLDQLQLAIAPDEGRLEAGRLQRAAAGRDDPQRAPQVDRLRLPLQLVLPGALVDDCLLGRPPGGIADEHRSGLSCGLDPRSGVHKVSRNHPLALGAECHRRLAGQHAGPRLQRLVELRNRCDEVERRPDGPLGVVLRGRRRAPYRHDRVADELLHRAPVALDQRAGQLGVAREQLARLLRVAGLGDGREADEVDEQDGHEATFRGGNLVRSGCDRWRCRGQRRAALAAEALSRLVRRAAGRAEQSKSSPRNPSRTCAPHGSRCHSPGRSCVLKDPSPWSPT